MRKSRIPVTDRASERGVLGALVAARREELDLRQVDLAELAGCGNRFVADLEAGKMTLRLDKLLDVLRALGLHLEIEGGSGTRVAAGARIAAVYGLDGPQPGVAQ